MMRPILPVVLAALAVLSLVSLSAAQVTRPAETFPKAKLLVQDGPKTKMINALLVYDGGALVVIDIAAAKARKVFGYPSITSAEYSFGKSPRWKTAIFVSPLFLFTSGKKHWFAVKAAEDYAILQLDKSNYKMILAAFETRTGKKVEIVSDNK